MSFLYRTKKRILASILVIILLGVGGCVLILRLQHNIPGHVSDPEKWELVFEDPFDVFNYSIWSHNYPGSNGGHTHNHNGYMYENNSYVENGMLRLRADNSRHPDAPDPQWAYGRWLTYNWTTGAVTSFENLSFKYGYIEASMRMPNSIGFWPAFWLLPADGTWPPEIDIHEYLSNDPERVFGTYHWIYDDEDGYQSFPNFKNTGENLSDDFHTYGLEWAPNYLAWYFDGVKYGLSYTNEENIAQLGSQYILINLAVGGWADNPDDSTIWPAYYDTDYLKIWQLKADYAYSGQYIGQ